MLVAIDSIPIAGGGVGGAQGSFLFVIKGEQKDVEETMRLVKGMKGTKLPEVERPDCQTCRFAEFYF